FSAGIRNPVRASSLRLRLSTADFWWNIPIREDFDRMPSVRRKPARKMRHRASLGGDLGLGSITGTSSLGGRRSPLRDRDEPRRNVRHHAVDAEPKQPLDCALLVHRPDMYLEAEPAGGGKRLHADEIDVAETLGDLQRASLGRIPLEAIGEAT